VPAGATGAPRAGPFGFPRFAGLPEHEVQRILLVRVVRVVATLIGGGQQLCVSTEPCHFAVGRLTAHIKKDVAVADIGFAVADESFDDGNHARDFFGDFGEEIRRKEIHVAAVFDELVNFTFGQRIPRNVVTVGAFEERIINIGDVLTVRDLAALGAYVADEHVKDEEGVGVPDVSRIVGGDATYVERQRPVGGDVKRGFVPAKRIKELHEVGSLL